MLDKATGKYSGNPRITSVIVTWENYIGAQLEALVSQEYNFASWC